MTIYLETDLGILYHGDCLEIMPGLQADLVLTDPPYGIGESNYKNLSRYTNSGHVIDYGDEFKDIMPPPEYFELVQRISKNQIIFGGNYFTEWLPATSSWIVWDKLNSGDFADCELIWTSFDGAVRKISWLWNGFKKELKERRYHLTQKPLGLIIKIMDKYSKPNSLILDTHAGSGTTIVACERTRHKWVAIEIVENYCEIIANRVEHERKQLKLFDN